MIYRTPGLKMGGDVIMIDEYTQQMTNIDRIRLIAEELGKISK